MNFHSNLPAKEEKRVEKKTDEGRIEGEGGEEGEEKKRFGRKRSEERRRKEGRTIIIKGKEGGGMEDES